MADWKGYKCLELKGSFLTPGFSIYLLEIKNAKNGEQYFYIGMTGDPFYPSARAAFHRISGHLELSKHSTQNQLMVALRKQGIGEEDYSFLIINMHHYPIDGYKKWVLSKDMKSEEIKKNKNSSEYLTYKKRQVEIENFEDALIFKIKEKVGAKLLNKTNGKFNKESKEFTPIINDILRRVRNV